MPCGDGAHNFRAHKDENGIANAHCGKTLALAVHALLTMRVIPAPWAKLRALLALGWRDGIYRQARDAH
jgi:hypothetical protein